MSVKSLFSLENIFFNYLFLHNSAHNNATVICILKQYKSNYCGYIVPKNPIYNYLQRYIFFAIATSIFFYSLHKISTFFVYFILYFSI